MGERIPTIYHVEGSDNMEEKKLQAQRTHQNRISWHKDALVPGEKHERKEKYFEIFESATEAVAKLMSKYGYESKPIEISQVHFIEEPEDGLMERNSGVYRINDHSIRVVEQENDLDTIQTLIHEMLHYQSFQTLTYDKDIEAPLKVRAGYAHSTHEGSRLSILNEALTEMYSIESIDDSYENKDNPYLNDIVDKLLDEDEILNFSHGMIKTIGPKISMRSGYREEINLIKRIILAVGTDVVSFGTFKQDLADGYFGGNMLKVAKKLETSFGRGFFRKLSEDLPVSEYTVDIVKRIEKLNKLLSINNET